MFWVNTVTGIKKKIKKGNNLISFIINKRISLKAQTSIEPIRIDPHISRRVIKNTVINICRSSLWMLSYLWKIWILSFITQSLVIYQNIYCTFLTTCSDSLKISPFNWWLADNIFHINCYYSTLLLQKLKISI